MFTVWLGPRPAVVLCGYAALRDALVLQADTFSGRGTVAIFERFTRGNGEALGVLGGWHCPFAAGATRGGARHGAGPGGAAEPTKIHSEGCGRGEGVRPAPQAANRNAR